MKEITIKTQKQYDKLPSGFKEETKIIIVGELFEITHKDKAVYVVSDNTTIQYVWDNATIQYVRDNATIQYVWGNATIQYVWDNATIRDVGGNATIRDVRGNATIQYVWGNATIQDAGGNATIQTLSGNSTLKIYGESVSVKKAIQDSIIICQDCKPKLPKHDNIIYTKRAKHDIKSFTDIYSDLVTGKKIKLYKSVNPETRCDFYTGKVKYEGIVTYTDFDSDTERQCGGGLHLSPTPQMALQYNNGLVLECMVDIKDIVVYPYDISKVRCRKVKVISEVVV